MSEEHARDDVVTVHTPMGSAYVGKCVCGWKTDEIGNKGAAGFSLSAHVKKGNGLPVFGRTSADDADAVRAEFDRITTREFDGYTLPATLQKVTSGDYRITDYRSLRMRGTDWDPFTAKLQRREGSGWKTVATVEDEGHGGAWDIQFLDGETFEHEGHRYPKDCSLYEVYGSIPVIDHATGQEVTGYAKYAAQATPEVIRFVDWCLAMPGKQVPFDPDSEPSDWTPHAVVGLLIDEAAAMKTLNGKRTRTPILEEGMDPTKGYAELSGGSRDPKVVAQYLIRQGKPTARIWTDSAWRTVQEVLK